MGRPARGRAVATMSGALRVPLKAQQRSNREIAGTQKSHVSVQIARITAGNRQNTALCDRQPNSRPGCCSRFPCQSPPDDPARSRHTGLVRGFAFRALPMDGSRLLLSQAANPIDTHVAIAALPPIAVARRTRRHADGLGECAAAASSPPRTRSASSWAPSAGSAGT